MTEAVMVGWRLLFYCSTMNLYCFFSSKLYAHINIRSLSKKKWPDKNYIIIYYIVYSSVQSESPL